MSIYKMRSLFGSWVKIVILGAIIVIFVVGAFWSFGGGAGDMGGKGNVGALDAVIARVNGDEITRGEFESAWMQAAENARNQGIHSPLQYADARAGIMQRLVQSRLILQAADELHVDVSDSKAEEEVDKIVTMYLNQNRQVVLGKLSKKQQATDPRDDSEYRGQLASVGSSIDQQEEMIRSRVPIAEVKADLAKQGIQSELMKRVKPVTQTDIADSYNSYNIRQIVLMAGKLPKAQVGNKAEKIRAEAQGGKDFATLAKLNSDYPDKATGGAAVYSFDTRFMFMPEVAKVIQGMKPGEISPIIDTQIGLFIVKLENIVPKMPAKLDAKAKKQRMDQIKQERQMSVMQAFQSEIGSKQKVDVLDPELLAYWQVGQAQQQASNPAAYQKYMAMALKSMQRAVKERENNQFAQAKLAQLQQQTGHTEEAIRLLYRMLEGKEATVESPDLRIMLGDLLVLKHKPTEDARAIKQYQVASESARNDIAIREQLLTKFQQLKRADLAAQESKLIAEAKQRMADLKALEAKRNPGKGASGAPGAPVPVSNTPPR